jgi:hypothetical protein
LIGRRAEARINWRSRVHKISKQREDPVKKVALAIAAVAIALIGPGNRSANADSLYIGDVNDNTVKRFDARTGAYLGVFVTNNGCLNPNPNSPPPACLYGPRSLIFDGHGDFDAHGHLLVANQNVTLNVNGAINEYNHTGAFVKALVPDDSKGPPAPLTGFSMYLTTRYLEEPMAMFCVSTQRHEISKIFR